MKKLIYLFLIIFYLANVNSLSICSEEYCEEQERIFTTDDLVYISGNANYPYIVSPDGFRRNISLPSVLDLNREGAYEIVYNLSGKEYKEYIAILNRVPKIVEVGICDSDSVCEKQENTKNCPQDCNDKTGFNSFMSFVIFLISFILFVFLVIYIWRGYIK
ncbi:MAG: hypothetical protein ACOCUI_03010 [bacterium]